MRKHEVDVIVLTRYITADAKAVYKFPPLKVPEATADAGMLSDEELIN